MSELSNVIDSIDEAINNPEVYCPTLVKFLNVIAKEVERQGILLDNIDANTVKKYVKR